MKPTTPRGRANVEKRRKLEDFVWELKRKLYAPQLDLWAGRPTIHIRSMVEQQSADALRLYREIVR